MFDIIALDADDTLWHNEPLYTQTQEKFCQLLKPYHDLEWIQKRLNETEIRNLEFFGYGVKGFILSMIETAIELSEGRISGREIQEIINLGRQMLRAPIELLDHVKETIPRLSRLYPLMLITKGDLFDQETKIARSALADYFKRVEIVSEKTADVYRAILEKYGYDPKRFLMVGNSLKSDILPVLAIGGQAVFIKYPTTWAHEAVDEEETRNANYFEIDHIGKIFEFLGDLQKGHT
jgi:putative hydrolase of the HAD superfamily